MLTLYLVTESILFFRGDTKCFAIDVEESGAIKNKDPDKTLPRR